MDWDAAFGCGVRVTVGFLRRGGFEFQAFLELRRVCDTKKSARRSAARLFRKSGLKGVGGKCVLAECRGWRWGRVVSRERRAETREDGTMKQLGALLERH